MELEINLPDYVNKEHGEYYATLIIEAKMLKNYEAGEAWGRPYRNETDEIVVEDYGTLITYDKDGYESRRIQKVDPFEYVSIDRIAEELYD